MTILTGADGRRYRLDDQGLEAISERPAPLASSRTGPILRSSPEQESAGSMFELP